MNNDHYRALERMYLQAAINEFYPPTIQVSEKKAVISLEVIPAYFHVMGAMHGSVYFKLLDDSCAFAAASIQETHPMVTATFTTKFRRPVSSGRVTAVATVVRIDGAKIFTEGVLLDENEQEIGSGEGLFLPAKQITLADVSTYQR